MIGIHQCTVMWTGFPCGDVIVRWKYRNLFPQRLFVQVLVAAVYLHTYENAETHYTVVIRYNYRRLDLMDTLLDKYWGQKDLNNMIVNFSGICIVRIWICVGGFRFFLALKHITSFNKATASSEMKLIMIRLESQPSTKIPFHIK